MISVILIMLWLLTCTLCAVGGYFYALKDKKHTKPPPGVNTLSAEEEKKESKTKAELSNFYTYDGSEQG